MRANSAHRTSALFLEYFTCFGNGTSRIDEVVHHYDVFVLDISDYLHGSHLVGAFPVFVNDHHVHLEVLGKSTGPFGAADIRRGNYQIFEIKASYVGHENERPVEVIHRYIEEALYLTGVKIAGHDAVGSCCGDKVCH